MIKSLLIKLFQAHKNTKFEFLPGVNVIAGESDAGKSAVIRAASWLFTNRPQGFSFKNKEAGEKDVTEVTIEMVGGEEVSRRKSSKGINEYYFPEETFKALRTDVPEEVRDVFQMGEVNIQSQHSPYFLLLDSPGDVAKKLNSLIGVDIIDSILSKINRKAATHSAESKAAKEETKRLSEKIDLYPDLDALEKEAEQAVLIEEQLNDKLEDKHSIENILSSVLSSSLNRSQLPDIGSIEISLESLEADYKELREAEIQSDAVKRIVRQIQEAKRKIEESQDDLEIYLPQIKSLENQLQELYEARVEKKNIHEIISYIVAGESHVEVWEKRVTDFESDLKALIEENPICPLCGKDMR